MPGVFLAVGIVLIGFIIFMLTVMALALRYYIKLPTDRALVITGFTGKRYARLDGALVVPKLDRSEAVDLTTKTIAFGKTPVRTAPTRDGDQLNGPVILDLRVKASPPAILKVADKVGAHTTFHLDRLQSALEDDVWTVIREVAREHEMTELDDAHETWKHEIRTRIERAGWGFVVDDVRRSDSPAER